MSDIDVRWWVNKNDGKEHQSFGIEYAGKPFGMHYNANGDTRINTPQMALVWTRIGMAVSDDIDQLATL